MKDQTNWKGDVGPRKQEIQLLSKCRCLSLSPRNSLRRGGWLLLGSVMPFRDPDYAPPHFIVIISGPELGHSHTNFPSLGKRKENSGEREYNVWRSKQWSAIYHFCPTLCHSHGHIPLQRSVGEFSLWLGSHVPSMLISKEGDNGKNWFRSHFFKKSKCLRLCIPTNEFRNIITPKRPDRSRDQ